uniref:Permease YjgP/YjgQ family protein n=1 Tax=Cyanidium caldarium TaxID=2771 RepID=Q9TLY0_CYACA|nr:hypothetical protein JXY51_pgp083 [Cyanidium caldarium]AAF12956.1 unknown [Cyanidium caldarium]WDB00261.1 hypothetical protein CDCA019_139 [Cyanidium caldarium]
MALLLSELLKITTQLIQYFIDFTILDSYLFKSLVLPFLFCWVSFVFIELSVGCVNQLMSDLSSGLPLEISLQILLLYLPLYAYFALPITSFFSGLISFRIKNYSNQLLGVYITSISFSRLFRSVLIFTSAICGTTWCISEIIIPVSSNSLQVLHRKASLCARNSICSETSSGIFTNYYNSQSKKAPLKELKGVLYIKHFNHLNAYQLIYLDFNNENLKQLFLADSAKFDHFSRNWLFENMHIFSFDYDKELFVDSFNINMNLCNLSILDLKLNAVINKSQFSPFWMNAASIKMYKELSHLKTYSKSWRKLSLRLYQKYFTPISSIFLYSTGALMGSFRYKTQYLSFFIGILIAFQFYLSTFVTESAVILGIIPIYFSFIVPTSLTVILLLVLRRISL